MFNKYFIFVLFFNGRLKYFSNIDIKKNPIRSETSIVKQKMHLIISKHFFIYFQETSLLFFHLQDTRKNTISMCKIIWFNSSTSISLQFFKFSLKNKMNAKENVTLSTYSKNPESPFATQCLHQQLIENWYLTFFVLFCNSLLCEKVFQINHSR